MKFYIATSLERADAHNLVRDYLVRLGHTITYDWTTHGSVQMEGIDRIREVALDEMRGVLEADAVIVLLPGGRGTHTELGMALAARKPVFLHGRDSSSFLDHTGRTCAFYYDPLVYRSEKPNILNELHKWPHTPAVRRVEETPASYPEGIGCGDSPIFEPGIICAL